LEHLGHDVSVLGFDLGRVGDVLAGDHQEMHWGSRIYVEKSVRLLAGDHLFGGHFTGQDLAEQAISHQHEATLTAVDPTPSPGERLAAAFERWAASERITEAAASRRRWRSLSEQASASATWTGVLLDLAERAEPVVVCIGADRLTGRLVGLGPDFCVLEQAGGRPAVVRSAAVCSLSPAETRRSETPAGQRFPALELSLASVLEALAGERAPVVVHCGGAPIEGELLSVGSDLVTLRADGQPRRLTHVPLGALTWCELR
jgi:hypothetical protein